MATTRIDMKVATNPMGITFIISSLGRNMAGYLWPSLRVLQGWGLSLLPFLVSNFYFPISIFYLQAGAEFACGDILQGAQARVEFSRGEAPLAVERAQKVRSSTVALARVAFETAGNQVAVGIAAEAHAWHDVVQAPHVSGSAAKAVKARATFAIVNGFAELPGFQEIRAFYRRGRPLPRGSRDQCRAVFARPDRPDLLGQAHLHEMAGLVAFQHAQSPQLIQPAHRIARRSDGEPQ